MVHSREFGPYGWYYLHTMSFHYNSEFTKHYNFVIDHVGLVLPCPVCRQHYKHQHSLINVSNIVNNEQHLQKWLIQIHNNINKLYKRKNFSYEQAREMYSGNIDYNKIFKFFEYIMNNINYINYKWTYEFMNNAIASFPDPDKRYLVGMYNNLDSLKIWWNDFREKMKF